MTLLLKIFQINQMGVEKKRIEVWFVDQTDMVAGPWLWLSVDQVHIGFIPRFSPQRPNLPN